jgi:hypothetical protein
MLSLRSQGVAVTQIDGIPVSGRRIRVPAGKHIVSIELELKIANLTLMAEGKADVDIEHGHVYRPRGIIRGKYNRGAHGTDQTAMRAGFWIEDLAWSEEEKDATEKRTEQSKLDSPVFSGPARR